MLTLVLAAFLIAAASPWIDRVAGRWTGILLALAPLTMFVWFAGQADSVRSGQAVVQSLAWAPALEVNLSFYLDGLSLLFALLITGIGTLIVFYAGSYLRTHPARGRFYAWLLTFMAAMLGLVLSDNLITIFLFWELTSISSYFLIGFDHRREAARRAALQALLVTGLGGLAMLAGLLMLGHTGGSFEMSELLGTGDRLRDHSLYVPILLLILAGCFTKSAQFPFHFWLPNAMEAPTPVSAYLHSSTMVKAGIYLMARVSPMLGGTELWFAMLTIVGGVTMLFGAVLAIRQTYLKRILAYSTISALGVLTFLLGIGAAGAWLSESVEPEMALYAAQAFAVFLLAHALYKATLFLVAGSVAAQTGTADIGDLGRIARAMPMTAAAAVLAALSMAGFPPFFGFVSKELLLEATLKQPAVGSVLTAAAMVAGTLFVVVSCLVAFRPFFGRPGGGTAKPAEEPPLPMWISPLLLGLAGLVCGLLPQRIAEPLVTPVVAGLLGTAQEVPVHLVVWHGFNMELALGLIAIAAGVTLYAGHEKMTRVLAPLGALEKLGPEVWYRRGLDTLMAVGRAQTKLLQSGYLRNYLRIILITAIGLIGYAISRLEPLPIRIEWPAADMARWGYENLYLLMTSCLILIGAVGAVHSRSRIAAVASLGVVGYGVALIYVFYGAPDLAITQFLVETLTVLLFMFVFYHLPGSQRVSAPTHRIRDLVVAGTMGVIMSVLVLVAVNLQLHEKISHFFAEQSVDIGRGRNIVNVILVDFRALDTLGEIVVLAVAAIGVLALLKLRPRREEGA